MKKIDELSIDRIKLIVFDVDGVLVKRGTEIKCTDNSVSFKFKKIAQKQIDQLLSLYHLGYHLNISSGRSLFFLQYMFREIMPYISITYENGSASWDEGRIIQNINSFVYLKEVQEDLLKIDDKKIKGWEPKEFIITIHCDDEVRQIKDIVNCYTGLYCIWNGEAYDIGVKSRQTKGVGLLSLMQKMFLERDEVLCIGDNLNDQELLNVAGVSVTADKSRVSGDFWIPFDDERLPADILMTKIIESQRREA